MTLEEDTTVGQERRTREGVPPEHEPIDVLLIEDNAGDAVLVRQIVSQERYSIRLHVAVDGEQALQMLADEGTQPRLIILDLNIPRIPGLSLLARWRYSEVPVVVFSSSWNEAEIERSLALGAREFVHKPNDLDEFAAAVSHIVEHWAKPHDASD